MSFSPGSSLFAAGPACTGGTCSVPVPYTVRYEQDRTSYRCCIEYVRTGTYFTYVRTSTNSPLVGSRCTCSTQTPRRNVRLFSACCVVHRNIRSPSRHRSRLTLTTTASLYCVCVSSLHRPFCAAAKGIGSMPSKLEFGKKLNSIVFAMKSRSSKKATVQ